MLGRNAVVFTLCVTVLLPMTMGTWMVERHETCSVTTTIPIECAPSLKARTDNHVDVICSDLNKQENCGKLSLHSFVYNLTCDEDYITDGSTVYTLHNNGTWMPRLPGCKRWCEPLKSLTMDVRCEYKGQNIDCSERVPTGTEATGRCKVGYRPSEKPDSSTTVCNEYGQWSHNFSDCVNPACGLTNSTELVKISWYTDTSMETTGFTFPWVVMVYRYGSLQCFGTLISSDIVLTAAHCVYSEMDRHAWDTETFEVIIANLYESSREQLIDQAIYVNQISVHPQYFGEDTSYAFNIALMKLETRVPHTPACLDWDREIDFGPREKGMVTGRFHNQLLVDTLYEYMDYGSCVSGLERKHRRYLTSDKFCNKHVEGSPKVFDRGSGLMFERNGIYFVKAVIHHGWYILDHCGECISFAMDLSDTGLLNWLKQTMESLDHDMDNYI